MQDVEKFIGSGFGAFATAGFPLLASGEGFASLFAPCVSGYSLSAAILLLNLFAVLGSLLLSLSEYFTAFLKTGHLAFAKPVQKLSAFLNVQEAFLFDFYDFLSQTLLFFWRQLVIILKNMGLCFQGLSWHLGAG